MKFKRVSQAEQLGGFWLVTLKLPSADPLPLGFKLYADQHPLVLFQQTQDNGQFFAQAPIEEQAEFTLQEKKYQAWQSSPTTELNPETPLIAIASNVNMAAAFDLAKRLKDSHQLSVVMHSDHQFPFVVKPAQFMWPDFPAEAIGAATLLEDWKIRNRLCSNEMLPGCFEGSLTDLFEEWQPDNSWRILDLNCL